MKTKVKRMSKRTLAIFLGIMMLVTSIGLGTILTANAYDTATLYYSFSGTGSLGSTSSFSISGNSATTTVSMSASQTIYFAVKANNDWYANGGTFTLDSNRGLGLMNSYSESNRGSDCIFTASSAGTYTFQLTDLTYNSFKMTISSSGGGDSTTYYYKGAMNAWGTGTALSKTGSISYIQATAGDFKITTSADSYDGELNNSNINNTLGDGSIILGTGDSTNINLPSDGYICVSNGSVYATTTDPSGGGDSSGPWYIRGPLATKTSNADCTAAGNTVDTATYWNALDQLTLTNTSGTIWTYTITNVPAGTYTYKVTDGTSWYPGSNKTVEVTTAGSSITVTYDSSSSHTVSDSVTPPAAGEFKCNDYDLQYTWINSASKDCDAEYKKTEIQNITLVAGHANSGYSYYVPVVFLDANQNSSHDKYFFGSATADSGSASKQTFSVEVSNLVADIYRVKVGVLGFDNQSDANTAAAIGSASSLDTTDYNFSSNGTSADWYSDANRILTVSDESASATLTARLTVNGISEGKDFGLYNDADTDIELYAFCNNGNSAIHTVDRDIEAKTAKSYAFRYYYYKNNDSSNPHQIGTTQYETADNTAKPVVNNTISAKLGDLGTFDDDDTLHFYVYMQAFSDTGHSTAITLPNCSSEEKGLINGHITSTRKGEAVSGSGDLWVDTAPNCNDTNTLVKWSNKQGPTASTSGSQYYFYLPKNSNVDISTGTYTDTRLTFYYDSSVISNVKISTSASGTYYDIESDSTFHNNNLYIQAGTQYYIKFTPAGGSEQTRTVKFIQGSESVAQLYIKSPSDMYDSTDGAVTDDATASAKKSASNQNGTNVTSIKADGSDDLVTAEIKKLKGRGNSSWKASAQIFGKYAYNLTLNKKANLLGVAGSGNKNKKYCLLANDFDSTQARNAFIFNLAKSLGLDYTPNFKMVDLYNNGTYLGSYLVTQAVDLGDDKLISENEIEQDEVNDGSSATGTYNGQYIQYYTGIGVTSASNYKTGTYLLEFDLRDRAKAEASCFESNQGQYITVSSPEFATQEEVKFIKDAWDEVETAVYDHRLDEVRDKVDVESFVKMYIIQELSKNLDSAASSYNILYKASEGKFYAQPVWDYDWAVGNYWRTKDVIEGTNFSNDPSTTTGYFSRYKKILLADGNALNKFNFQAMLCDNESFWADVQNVWANEANAKSADENDNISDYMDSIQASVEMNDTRWGHLAINNSSSSASHEWGTVSGQGSTYDNVQTSLTTWITNRIAYFNHASTGIAETGSSTTNYTVGVATNWDQAAVSATAIGIDGVENTTSSFTEKTTTVPEYTYVTFKAATNNKTKEFKGWFTVLDPNTSGGTTNNHNAVSMEEEFSAMVRSNVKIYALYSDKQDDSNDGIVSGSIYYYSAPTISLEVQDDGGVVTNTAAKGDTLNLVATITDEADRYVDRVIDDEYVARYVYNFYTVDSKGNKTLIDSQVGAASDDARLTHTLPYTFDDTTYFYAEAYCVNVDPEESPFSVGKITNNQKVENDTEIKTEKIKVYVDFTGKTITDSSTAVVRAIDDNGIIQSYPLERLGTSAIYVANDVIAAYSVKNNKNTSKFTLVSIDADGKTMAVPDAQQPDLSGLLSHKTLWYKATGDLASNFSQEFYHVNGNIDTHVNSEEFVESVYRTQGSELSTKRIYLTNNLSQNFSTTWEHINIVYTVDKSVSMYHATNWYTGYSNDHTDVVWFTKRMEEAGYGNVGGQGLLYVDLPYNVTAYYFENGEFGATEKLEVMYSTGSSDLGESYSYSGESHNDKTYYQSNPDDINAYYISAYKAAYSSDDKTAGRVNGYVRMWPSHDWPATAYLSEFKQDVYIAKGENLDITPTAQNASVGVFYESDNTSVASVTSGGTLSGVTKGTAHVTITPVGYANGTTTQAPGIVQTVKVTVVDKDKLRKMISEAETIIAAHNNGTGTNYTADSYDAFDDVYNAALSVYNKSLYSQTEIDYYADLLEDAMNNLHTASSISSNIYTLIAYNSSKVIFRSDGHGNIGVPTINANYENTVKNAAGANNDVNIAQNTITPYVKTVTATQEYELLYAEGLAVADTATVADEAFPFTNWTKDDVQVTTNAELTIAEAESGESEYLAHFDAPDYELSINYKFYDFDDVKAGTYEYVDGCEKDTKSSYQVKTTLTAEETNAYKSAHSTVDQIRSSKLFELVTDFTPDIISAYYNYKFPKSSNLTNSDYFNVSFDDTNHKVTATVNLSNTMKKYSVYLNGSLIGSNYHYQQEISLDAVSDAALPAGNSYIWWLTDERINNVSTESFDDSSKALAYKDDGETEFRVRALEEDMYINVAAGTNLSTDNVDKKSIISNAYREVVYKNNNKRLQQNFYIQNNIKQKENFVACGNLFYYWNTETNRPANDTVNTKFGSSITNSTLENVINTNLSSWKSAANDAADGKASGKYNGMNYTFYVKKDGETDTTGILHYSTLNNFYSYFFAVNSLSNQEKYGDWEYRVHSFMIYDDNGTERIALSNTYASAPVYWGTSDLEEES